MIDVPLFEIQHLFVEKNLVVCTKDNFPNWMKHREMKWWVDDFVLKLKCGESIESDFHKITRLQP